MTSQPSLDENVATFDRRGFRNALASFPTGVTVISTRGEQGALVEKVSIRRHDFR